MVKINSSSKAGVQIHFHLLRKQYQLISDTLSKWPTNSEFNYCLFALTYSVQNSCRSLLILAQSLQIRDCFIISRTILDTILNIGYISSKGQPAFKKAKKHLLQKGYRDLERELEISRFKISLRYEGKDKIKIPTELQEAINEFTNKKGYEVSLWTPESTIQKIKIINSVHHERASNQLTISLFFIYRHASEIAHGTLFGIYFTTGNLPFEKPIKNRDEMKNYQRSMLCALLLCISIALDSLLIILSKHYDIGNIVKQSNKNLKEYSEIVKIEFDEEVDDLEEYLKKHFGRK